MKNHKQFQKAIPLEINNGEIDPEKLFCDKKYIDQALNKERI